MVAACDMGMSPVMRGEGERRKSLWPKLSGGSGNGRGVESGDKGEADGMTTDRSSLSMRSVNSLSVNLLSPIRSARRSAFTRSFHRRIWDLEFSREETFQQIQADMHAIHVLVRQVRPDSPVRQRRCHMCPTVKTLNCKSPGGPRSPRAAKLDRRSRRVVSRTGNRHGKMDEKTLSAFAATVEKYNSYRHVSV